MYFSSVELMSMLTYFSLVYFLSAVSLSENNSQMCGLIAQMKILVMKIMVEYLIVFREGNFIWNSGSWKFWHFLPMSRQICQNV